MLLMDKKQKIICAALAAGAVAVGIVGYGESKKIEAAKKSDNFLQASKCIETLSECSSIINLDWLSDDLGLKVASRVAEQQSIDAIEDPAEKCIKRGGADFYCKDVNKVKLREINPSLYKELNNVLWAEKQRKAKAEEQKRIAAERATWGKWSYTEFTDDASGKKGTRATLLSENTVELSFPYSGPQYGTLQIRNHPRFGFHVIFSISRGQIVSSTSWDNETMVIRFDDGEATTWSYGEPSDNSSEYAFIQPEGRFEAMMKKAKKVYITPTLYQAGSRTFRFNVKGYDASKI